MFGTIGGPELILIFVIALIVFGPRKLPEIGRSLGKMLQEFRKASNEFRHTLEDEVDAEKRRDLDKARSPYASSVTAAPAEAPAAAATNTQTAAPPEPLAAGPISQDRVPSEPLPPIEPK